MPSSTHPHLPEVKAALLTYFEEVALGDFQCQDFYRMEETCDADEEYVRMMFSC